MEFSCRNLRKIVEHAWCSFRGSERAAYTPSLGTLFVAGVGGVSPCRGRRDHTEGTKVRGGHRGFRGSRWSRRDGPLERWLLPRSGTNREKTVSSDFLDAPDFSNV